jgi:hypothetical protein
VCTACELITYVAHVSRPLNQQQQQQHEEEQQQQAVPAPAAALQPGPPALLSPKQLWARFMDPLNTEIFSIALPVSADLAAWQLASLAGTVQNKLQCTHLTATHGLIITHVQMQQQSSHLL